jgi:hypothetical protein
VINTHLAVVGRASSDASLIDRQVDVFRALGGGWQTAQTG